MSTKGKPLSQEHRAKISASHIGIGHSDETKEKLRLSHLGFKPSPEAIEKNRQSHIGKTATDAARINMSIAQKGKIVSEGTRRKIGLSKLGSKHNEETKNKIRSKLIGRSFSEETRNKISLALRGRVLTEEWKARIIASWRPVGINSNTSIEIKVAKLLEEMGLGFEQQAKINGVYGIMDFYIASLNGVIECDGDYWHSLEKGILSDSKKNESLRASGINLLRLPEHEINDEWDMVVIKVCQFLEACKEMDI